MVYLVDFRDYRMPSCHKMASDYYVKSVQLKNGGRLPLLFATNSPYPVSLVCRYVIQTLYSRALATNSILVEVRALADLYTWAAELTPPLDLESTLRKECLDMTWLLSFANWVKGRPKRTRSGVIQLTAEGTPSVRMGRTNNKIICSARDFLVWAAATQAKLPSESIKDCLRATLVISKRGARRVGFTAKQRAIILSVVHPESPDNPFNTPVRKRNYAIVKLLLETGIRRGELASLRVTDLYAGGAETRITVRKPASSRIDPRKMKASVKTRERDIALRDDTKALLVDLLVERRELAKKGIRIKHQFLIVAPSTGSPLTLDGVNSIFRRISKARPDLGWVYPHKLRHSFNDDFLTRGIAEGQNINSQDFVEMHNHTSGWSPISKTRSRYTILSMEDRAAEILRKQHGP